MASATTQLSLAGDMGSATIELSLASNMACATTLSTAVTLAWLVPPYNYLCPSATTQLFLPCML